MRMVGELFMGSKKSEIRSSKFHDSKHLLCFRVSSLFRISDFGFRISWQRFHFGLSSRRGVRSFLHGQDKSKHAAIIDDGFDRDAGFEFPGQFINHRKAEAGAAAGGHCLGGKEWLENSGHVFRRYSRTEILYRNS